MTIFLSSSIQPSNDIPIPNYRFVKGVVYGLLLLKFHISACISCSDIRTEKIRTSKTFLSSSKFLLYRSVKQTVCTAVSCVYRCIVQLYPDIVYSRTLRWLTHRFNFYRENLYVRACRFTCYGLHSCM